MVIARKSNFLYMFLKISKKVELSWVRPVTNKATPSRFYWIVMRFSTAKIQRMENNSGNDDRNRAQWD